MRRTNKKGFTIVELVIVIAVIAILAAVLIPTFASVVKKANLSADEQAVKQMNTALAIYTAENGKPSNIGQVQTALRSNGVNANAEPVTDGYAFYWDSAENVIVLVGAEKATVGETFTLLGSNGYGTIEKGVTDAATLKSAIERSTQKEPVLIQLQDDITAIDKIEVAEGKCVIIDLNKHSLSSGDGASVMFTAKEGGTLTLKNGNIKAAKRAIANIGGNVTLSDVKIVSSAMNTDSDGATSAVHIEGLSQTTIVDSEITFESGKYGFCLSTNSARTENDGSVITLINSTFATDMDGATGVLINTYSSVIIDNCTIKGGKSGLLLRGCNATVTNTTVERTSSKAIDTASGFGSGNYGKYGDIILGCGGSDMDGYAWTAKYVFENVTAVTGDVFVHEPNGGNVQVSGIEVNYKYKGMLNSGFGEAEYKGYHAGSSNGD